MVGFDRFVIRIGLKKGEFLDPGSQKEKFHPFLLGPQAPTVTYARATSSSAAIVSANVSVASGGIDKFNVTLLDPNTGGWTSPGSETANSTGNDLNITSLANGTSFTVEVQSYFGDGYTCQAELAGGSTNVTVCTGDISADHDQNKTP